MNCSFNGREEPAGFNHSSFFDAEKHELTLTSHKQQKSPLKQLLLKFQDILLIRKLRGKLRKN